VSTNKNTTLKGVKWNAINSVLSQSTMFITGIVLMRVLSPSSFGLVAMITVFTGFLNVIKNGGLNSSLIYKDNLRGVDKDTVFWFNVVVGVLLSVVFFVISKPIANYYGHVVLVDLIKVYSLIFAISSFSNIQYALLKKDLAFKEIFKAEVISIIVSAILAIISALYGLGVWSLIILHFSKTLFVTINLWLVSDYRPAIRFSRHVLKDHFGYSLPVIGTKSFNYWTRNADNFFIGKFLGADALGLYSRAFFFLRLPTQSISNVIEKTLFPSFSLIKNDKVKASELYLKSMRVTAFITFPLMGSMVVLSRSFIISFFGASWLPMLHTLQILGGLSILQSVFVFTTSLYFAQGKTSLHFRISLLFGLSNILAFYLGSQYSIELVGILLFSVFVAFIYPKLYYATRLINLSVKAVLMNLMKVFLNNLAVMILIFYLFELNSFFKNDWINLAVGFLCYVLFFMILNKLLYKRGVEEFFSYFRKLIKA